MVLVAVHSGLVVLLAVHSGLSSWSILMLSGITSGTLLYYLSTALILTPGSACCNSLNTIVCAFSGAFTEEIRNIEAESTNSELDIFTPASNGINRFITAFKKDVYIQR